MTQFLGPMTDKQKKKIQACRKMVEQYPHDAKTHFELGLACRKGKCWKEAAQSYEVSIRLDPKNKKAMHGLAISIGNLSDMSIPLAFAMRFYSSTQIMQKSISTLVWFMKNRGTGIKPLPSTVRLLNLTQMIIWCITIWHERMMR